MFQGEDFYDFFFWSLQKRLLVFCCHICCSRFSKLIFSQMQLQFDPRRQKVMALLPIIHSILKKKLCGHDPFH